MKDTTEILNQIKRIKAIADTGLLYSRNDYDRENYLELKEISFQLLNTLTGESLESIRNFYADVKDYPTVKVDVRALLLSPEKKILMVQEGMDGKWALPGGWADIGYSPKEVITKEVKEETGLDIIPKKLLAVFDKKMHPHPPSPFYIYKMVFYCEAISKELKKGFDLLDVQYFDSENLPPLSENRIVKSQIELLVRKVMRGDYETYFD